jgi:hypothetical protein
LIAVEDWQEQLALPSLLLVAQLMIDANGVL